MYTRKRKLRAHVVYLLLFFIEVNLQRVSPTYEISQIHWSIRGLEMHLTILLAVLRY